MGGSHRIALALAGVAFAGTVVSCSSGSSPTPSGPAGDPVAARTNPCALFHTAALENAFGFQLQEGRKVRGALEPSCDWYPQGNGSAVSAAVSKTAQRSFDGDIAGPVGHDYERTSPRLGDDSVWFGGAADAKTTASLIVLQGGYRYQVSVAVPDGTDYRDIRAKLLELADTEF